MVDDVVVDHRPVFARNLGVCELLGLRVCDLGVDFAAAKLREVEIAPLCGWNERQVKFGLKKFDARG